MPGSLSTYRRKRDFAATPEPKGRLARTGKTLSFVIQKHAARRLHYDFRLELDGTLKSWAVPRGPSLDPSAKRMAVRTEDHPLDYAGFEGVIPEGHYGAGTVIVWDRGEWEPSGDPRAGYREGKLKFELHGEKLHGRWMLVRVRGREDERQEPWLLIKERDEDARPASEYDVLEALPDSVLEKARAAKPGAKGKPGPKAKASSGSKAKASTGPKARKRAIGEPASLPLFLQPQLATLVDEAPAGEDWIYEVKLDGYRIVARIDGEDVKLFTRNGNDWSPRLERLAGEVRALGLRSAWLDGEIVALNDKGLPDFQKLQRAFDVSRTTDIVFYAFDLPWFDGRDLRRVPLLERRALLERILEGNESPHVRFSAHFTGPGPELLAAACEQGLEGLIGKRADAPYTSSRSTAWIKLKCRKRQEFVVGGWTDPRGSRNGFGSLLLGVHDAEGRLVYAGSVGTGFDEKLLASIKSKLDALATDASPFHERRRDVKGHWVRPRLVAEVAFTEWTGDGRIRHPVFQGLRTDKDPRAITREKAVEPPQSPGEAKKSPRRKAGRAASRRENDGAPVVAGRKVSNAGRVIDRSTGLTKLDLVRYYERIAPAILPHLEDRPVALVRAPTGVEGEGFFQKHVEAVKIPGIVELPRSLWPGHDPLIVIDTVEALVAAAQVNVIELHTINSTAGAIRKPDRMIFDLDPGEGVAWKHVLEATALVRKMLDHLGLESFVKTSGGKGLHVVVPLEPKLGYEAVRNFSEDVVVHMAKALPQLFVAKSGERNRVGRIFIDYLRNNWAASTVAAFSPRMRPGLPVSVPIRWSELAKLESPRQWTIANVHERLARLRTDPWRDYGKKRQGLSAAIRRLAAAKKG